MNENRIYGEKIDIDPAKVKEFYDKRAEKSMGNTPYSSVLLCDHSPDLIDEQLKIDKEILFPKMRIDSESIVLDVGCGIGRWAEQVIPICKYYYGVDFSQKMIDTAKKRMSQFKNDNYAFERMSFQELVKSECKEKSNRIIISGILVYICDDVIKECLKELNRFIDNKCIIYIWETCGLGQRLTLKDLPSEALNDNYNVIYRTKDEYDELFKIFTDNGFTTTFSEYYSAIGGTVTYTDSDKIYYILER